MKRDGLIREELGQFPVAELYNVQRRHGRANLPADFVAQWMQVNARANEVSDDRSRGVLVRKVAQFIVTVTSSIVELHRAPKPTYYPYTDVAVLDWYLGKRYEKLSQLQQRAAEGLSHLLQDLLDFESRSLGGLERHYQGHFDEQVCVRRIASIKEAAITCRAFAQDVQEQAGSEAPAEVRHHETFEGYVLEPSRVSGLVHFSCFPQTDFHDEYLFLRIIHISELCFYGLRSCVVAAIESLRRDNKQPAVLSLRRAQGFAKILQGAFKIMRTMPPENFRDFREATGDSSAINSRNYQLMELYFRGMNPAKKAHFTETPHLRFLISCAHPLFLHLGTALGKLDEHAADCAELFEAARVLDRQLLSWRGAHLFFAKVYLADIPIGTGGTAGAPYLQKVLNAGLFSDTRFDEAYLTELFPNFGEIIDAARVPSSRTIAP
jgi:tryptophan 2,3-dioxygenase